MEHNESKNQKLLTPLMLATAITTLSAPAIAFSYDHDAQLNLSSADDKIIVAMQTFTGGGTQTFDINGRPWDGDSDRD
jgi:hypothetical protein